MVVVQHRVHDASLLPHRAHAPAAFSDSRLGLGRHDTLLLRRERLVLGVDLLHVVVARLRVLLLASVASLSLLETGRRLVKDFSLVLRGDDALVDPA